MEVNNSKYAIIVSNYVKFNYNYYIVVYQDDIIVY